MIKLLPDTSFIFVFDSTDLPDQIAETAVSAIWADRAVGSKTKCLGRALPNLKRSPQYDTHVYCFSCKCKHECQPSFRNLGRQGRWINVPRNSKVDGLWLAFVCICSRSTRNMDRRNQRFRDIENIFSYRSR